MSNSIRVEVSYEGKGVQQYFHIVSGCSLWGLSFIILNWAWRGLLWNWLVWSTKAWRRWDYFWRYFWCLALFTDHSSVSFHEREIGLVPYIHEVNLKLLKAEWHHLEVNSKAWGELFWEKLLSFLSLLFINKFAEDIEAGERNSWEESLSDKNPLGETTCAATLWDGVVHSWAIHNGSKKHEDAGSGVVVLKIIWIFYIK